MTQRKRHLLEKLPIKASAFVSSPGSPGIIRCELLVFSDGTCSKIRLRYFGSEILET